MSFYGFNTNNLKTVSGLHTQNVSIYSNYVCHEIRYLELSFHKVQVFMRSPVVRSSLEVSRRVTKTHLFRITILLDLLSHRYHLYKSILLKHDKSTVFEKPSPSRLTFDSGSETYKLLRSDSMIKRIKT